MLTPAYSEFAEEDKGSPERGMLAGRPGCLSQDVFTIDPTEKDAKVITTQPREAT
jgi:hypothetical protein